MITIPKKTLFLIAVTVLLTVTQSLAKPPDRKSKNSNTDKNTTQLQKQLKQSDISSLEKPDSVGTKDSLAELIAQIESLDIPDTKTPTAPQSHSQTGETQKQPSSKEQVKPAPAQEKTVAPKPPKKQFAINWKCFQQTRNIPHRIVIYKITPYMLKITFPI